MFIRNYLIYFIAFLWLIGSTDTVSFYGESYIHIPLHDAFRETSVELRFKASRPYGVLFLLSGLSDYFLLQLHAGTLELKISYGMDETMVDLGNQRYDDLQWHDVKVTSKDDLVSITVDNATTARGRIIGEFRELNIDSGAYLGGANSKISAKFDHNLKSFRGAFSHLVFNDMDMISMAQRLTDPSLLVEISWDIDDLFNAPRNKPIYFQSETSFISFSHIHPTIDRTVSFLFNTDTPTALLMFSFTRHSIAKHLVALELINGRLRLTVSKGEETVSVSSDETINNKRWHQVDVSIASNAIELVVDSVRKSESFNDKKGAVYGGLLYLGGVNQNARALALHEKLDSLKGDNNMKGAIVGCVKNIIINSRAYNIHNIHASRLISAGCQGDDLCASQDCDTSKAVTEMTPFSDSSQDDFQVLSINPVAVDEDGRVEITTENIEIIHDFKRYGIRDSGIMIYVTEMPKYGRIEVDLGRRRNNNVFTYLDLSRKKVMYRNAGSEQTHDEVAMEMQVPSLSRRGVGVPEKMQKRYDFILPINIKPKNDAPKIILKNGGVLKIIENTKIRITSDFLHAEDPDTPANQLIYLVTEQPTQGYFEKAGTIGDPIFEFTQAEIDDRLIWFLNLGSGNSSVRMKLSDGLASSDPVELHIQTVQLRLTVVKNTGLVLPHGTFRLISNNNLTTISNVPTQEIEIMYDILNQPRFGILERQQYTDGEWRSVTTFAQRHVDNGHIRYRQTDPSNLPSSDHFKFQVKAKSDITPYYFFRIQFEQIYLTLETNNKLTLVQQPFGAISTQNLLAKTNNAQLQLENIRYTVMRPPSLGDFYRIDHRKRGQIDFGQGVRLGKDSVFTQADINNEKLYYKLKSSSFEKVQDFANLKVSTIGASSKHIRFWMEFIPAKSDISFINNGLKQVIEGGEKDIDKHCLYIQTLKFNVFEFTVISPPQHGTLKLVDHRSSAVIETNIKEFTNDDIKDLRLVYEHDDSETDEDSFTFTAVPIIQRTSLAQREIPEFTGTFEIQMLMRNDNPPERSVDKVFKVVRNGEKIITIDDLAFTDPDIGYDTDELLYKRLSGKANGDIVHVSNKSKIYQFRQKDIIDKQIMFRHYGDDHGTASLYVTDGQFNVNCLFEIEAGDPYVEVKKNSGAIVKHGKEVVITTNELSVETNVNTMIEELRFILIEEPRHGHLEVKGQEVLEFNLENLKNDELSYKHEGSSNAEDQFKFAVVAGETQIQASFSIQIQLESSKLPPRVINNHVLEVLDTGRKVIEQSHLLITHPDSSPENIEYLVLVLPKFGKLYRGTNQLTLDNDMTFTQSDINSRQVTYQLENASISTDQFIFEVSNGYEALRGLEFLINIIPSTVTFEVRNISVKEGGKKALTLNNIKINENYFEDQLLTFFVKMEPTHGIIQLNNNKGEAISTFTSEDLRQGRVYYSHDDSDSLYDEFSLSAAIQNTDGAKGLKESDIMTIYVTINGLNDEPPVVVKNEGLIVWKGSMTQITSDKLSAFDPDTPPEELVYRILSPSNGHVSLLNNTFKEISSFRQSWINDGLIVFVHTGDNIGEFSFQVTDGHNSNKLSTFHIEAKQLVLSLNTNMLLNAYPNTIQPITANDLSTVTNDPDQSKPIIYTVTSKPWHGSVVTMVESRVHEVASFTQKEINASQIFYMHSEKLKGWTQNDSVEFQVNTLYAEPLKNQVLEIYISYGNLNAENKHQLIRTSAINVDEGGEMIVAKNNLDVTEFVRNLERLGKRLSLRFSLEAPPHHGVLIYQGNNLLKNKRFSQRNINAHELIYKHDDSDTKFDTFNLTLHLRIEDSNLRGGEQDSETKFGLVLNVTIQPVNDQPFKLLTTNPSLDIIQGFSQVINQSILNTIDEDTVPAYIVYKIIRAAEHGYVAFVNDPFVEITSFSQQDVNENHVMYQHDGSTIEKVTFYFQVSDGAFRPYFREFRIYVSMISMEITTNATVILTQSDSSVFITQVNLNVSTNGLRENVTYIVTKQPRYGKVHLREREVLSFTQSDIDRNHVIYFQDNMKSGNDDFECDIKYRSTDILYTSRIIDIKVKPLVTQGSPVVAPRGERVALTLLSLDASKLSERTADNPMYTITKGPYFGKIVKRAKQKRQVNHENYRDSPGGGFKVVQEFSHEDVVYMKVFYESSVISGVHPEQENFTFVLTAFNVQPAVGVFYIDMLKSDITPVVPVSKSTEKVNIPVTQQPVTQSSEGSAKGSNSPINDGSVEPSSVKNDHVIVLAIIIPLLVLIIIVILVVFFVWRRRRKRDYTPTSKKSPRLRPHISGPYQIEQPHVHIEPQEQDSPVSEEAKSLVEYENCSNIPCASRAHSEEADIVTPMVSHDAHHVPRSPDVSRTEVSCTVPYCKVTPLIDNGTTDDDDGDDDDDGSPDNRKSTSSMGDMIDWITSDPELLQHCSSSEPPVLRNSQYWV